MPPAWVLRWLVIIGGITAAVLAYNWWASTLEQRGYDRAKGIYETREMGIQLAAQAKYSEELIVAQQRAQVLQDKVDDLTTLRTQMENEREKSLNDAVASALAGAERLRIRTKSASCSLPADPAQTAAADPGGPGPGEAELLPETAGRIVGFAGAEAKHVRDYNALLAYTRMIRTECTQPPGGNHGKDRAEDPRPDVPAVPALGVERVE